MFRTLDVIRRWFVVPEAGLPPSGLLVGGLARVRRARRGRNLALRADHIPHLVT